MRNAFITALAVVTFWIVMPAVASASTVTYAGGVVTVTAQPGEFNWVTLDVTTSCDVLAAPCLKVADAVTLPITAAGGCVAPIFSTFPAVLCPIPTSAVIDTGDMDDRISDWAGPSTITTGPGNDIVEGRDGDDAIDGGAGADVLIGGPGNDRLAGGPGGDRFESHLWPIEAFASETAGADRIEGGTGVDTASYRARDDNLSVTIDDLANDGGPGEGDFIGRDVEVVEAGAGDDTLTGDAAANTFAGGYGQDDIHGGSGDDTLVGGPEDDRLFGEDGADTVRGGHGNDLIDGGPGADDLLGDWAFACDITEPCEAGADVIRARDGVADYVNCGIGTDRATVDLRDVWIDAAGGSTCETVDRAAPPAAGAQLARAIVACKRLSGPRRGACVGLARAVARCKALPGSRRAACIRRARAVARCQSLAGKAARARCMKALPPANKR